MPLNPKVPIVPITAQFNKTLMVRKMKINLSPNNVVKQYNKIKNDGYIKKIFKYCWYKIIPKSLSEKDFWKSDPKYNLTFWGRMFHSNRKNVLSGLSL